MHSNGRGEEAPEPYRGVVLPAGQQPPVAYGGDQVQPAGGTPWGDPGQPAGAPPVPPQPPGYAPQAVEPADATQMLPPYPGAGPAPTPAPAPIPAAPPQPAAPVADATQMLPPYPGANPPEPAPAEATQALPLSIFQEQQQPPQQPSYDAYGQPQPPQGYAGQEFPEQPQYGEQQPYGVPQPYADPQSYGGQQQFAQQTGYDQPGQQPGPQHDSDYDHLFRNDVPGPEPLRQRIIQPPSAQQQHAQQAQQQGYGQPPWEPGYADDGYDDDDRRRGMSPKVVIGIVVAGCVVAGLVVGAMMNGGGKASADNKPSASATGKADGSGSASASPKAAAGGDAEAQAKALDSLLNTSGASRSSVVGAVESIRNCKNLPGAASDLRAAATQRTGLVTQLGGLSVDKLPNHEALTTALTKAWQASSAADGHYAAWADQAAGGGKVCKGGHARTTAEAQAGNKESGTATSQKKAAVKLWNAIATKYGLTQRQYSQL